VGNCDDGLDDEDADACEGCGVDCEDLEVVFGIVVGLCTYYGD